MTERHEPIDQLPSADWDKVQEVVARFEEAWEGGRRPAISEYWPTEGVARLALLVELAHTDLEYRLKAGESARVETYLEGYPELAADRPVLFGLIAAEYHLRRRREPDVTLAEYMQRFPDHGPQIGQLADPVPGTEVASADARAAARARSIAASPPAVQVAGYVILSKLGRGGMGVVYKARQTALGRVVALKMVLAGAHADELQRARFRIEAEIVARLQHPNIVQIYEVGEVKGLPFFSLEFVEGGSLAGKLDGPLWQARQAAELVRSLARAMHYAHQRGVVHRDLKPANILLTEAGVPKVTDFGLARRLDEDAGLSRSGDIMGTPSYMAPEQAEGRVHDVGPWTDVYALGAILYVLLTGRPPFKGRSTMETLDQVRRQEPAAPRELRPGTPFDLEIICLKCLRKATAGRYQAAADLAADLDRYLNGEPIHARPVGFVERTVKWARRRPTLAALAAVVLLAAAAAAAAVPWHIIDLQIKVAASNAEVNRLRDQEQAEKEARRRADVRADAQRWLSEGQEVLARGRANDLEDARVSFSKASDKIGDADAAADAALHGLKEEVVRRLAEVERRRGEQAAAAKARADYKEFFDLRDEAFFQLYRDAFAGPDPASPAASREAARKALALMGLDAERPGAPSLDPYPVWEKERLTAGLYEVLLLLAEATAKPLPDQPAAERRRQAEEALRILDRAEDLVPPTQTALRRRARYLEQRGDADAAAKERALADAVQPVTALDWFLTGFDQGQEGGTFARPSPITIGRFAWNPTSFGPNSSARSPWRSSRTSRRPAPA